MPAWWWLVKTTIASDSRDMLERTEHVGDVVRVICAIRLCSTRPMFKHHRTPPPRKKIKQCPRYPTLQLQYEYEEKYTFGGIPTTTGRLRFCSNRKHFAHSFPWKTWPNGNAPKSITLWTLSMLCCLCLVARTNLHFSHFCHFLF